jgi:hypothetical protein
MTSTTQDPSCAGKPAAYIQKYTFQGSLVTPSCVTVETPLTVSGQLHIGFLAEDGTISGAGTVVSDQGLQPRDRFNVAGEPTYPEWEVVSDPEHDLWRLIRDGLPREREGCQQVSGAIEWTGAGCLMRWEGTWFDN